MYLQKVYRVKAMFTLLNMEPDLGDESIVFLNNTAFYKASWRHIFIKLT
jgi:hypothetical protein